MVEQLFGSKTRIKLLKLFYSNPNRSFYVREITRKIDEQINSVRRELSNLLSIGIIVSDTKVSETNNNRLYYEVNQTFEFYEPLTEIFGGKRKAARADGGKTPQAATTSSEEDEMKVLGQVDLALYTGQFTRDDSAGVDFLLVGNVNPNALEKYVSELEKKEGKEIRYTVMSLADFKYRRQIKDRFITTVLDAKKQVLIDKHNLLGE
jgi:hypothetical protein